MSRSRGTSTGGCVRVMGARSLVLWSVSALTLIACGGDPQPADVVTDQSASDSMSVVDSGVAQDTGVVQDTGVAQDTGVSMDTGVTETDGASMDAAPVGCCRAFSMANQGRCASFESMGASACNNADDGTVCAWSLDSTCNDSGVMDSGPPPNCCLAISPANAAFCTALSSFGTDRCNRADGGGVCVWSGAMVCNPTPPMDSGTSDARSDAMSDAPMDSRTDASDASDARSDVADASDARSDVVSDSGVPSCCLARTGSNGPTCRTYTTMAQCTTATAMTRTCVWSPTPLCTSTLGNNGACCIPRSNMLQQPTCAALNTSATCGGNANCQWRCP